MTTPSQLSVAFDSHLLFTSLPYKCSLPDLPILYTTCLGEEKQVPDLPLPVPLQGTTSTGHGA